MLAGKPSRQIAEQLSISARTVEFHRARIMQKFGVRTAAERFRRSLGWMELSLNPGLVVQCGKTLQFSLGASVV